MKWTEGPIPGHPVLTFAPKDFFVSQRSLRGRPTADMTKFVDATSDAGFPGDVGAPLTRRKDHQHSPSVTSMATDATTSSCPCGRRRRARRSCDSISVQGGFVRDDTQRSGITPPQGAAFATFADFDNDGWLDLFVIGGEGRNHLFRNNGNEHVRRCDGESRHPGDPKGAHKAVFADLDHDGDLDLLLTGGPQRIVYRNNLDGTFTEATAAFGLAGGGDPSDAAYGDFDGDGRLDLFIANEKASDALLRNDGAERFTDVTAKSGVATTGGSGAVTAGDYNNDGFLDLLASSLARREWRRSNALAQQGRWNVHPRYAFERRACECAHGRWRGRDVRRLRQRRMARHRGRLARRKGSVADDLIAEEREWKVRSTARR